MYCRTCGKEITDDVGFCNNCGSEVGTEAVFTPSPTVSVSYDGKIDGSSMLPLVLAVVICYGLLIAFSFFPWNQAGLTRKMIKAWGMLFDPDTNNRIRDIGLLFYSFLLNGLKLAIMIVCGINIYKMCTCGTKLDNNWHIVSGYGAMLGTLIFWCITFLLSFFCEPDNMKISFTPIFYACPCLMALNRFVFLKVLSVQHYRLSEAYKRLQPVTQDFGPGFSGFASGEWICSNCNQRNEERSFYCIRCRKRRS